jgi:hypothetical protein
MGKAFFTQGVRLCALLLILVWAVFVTAQTTPVSPPEKPVPIKGTWALQGQLGTALSASKYSYTISAQHYSSKTKAIRYSVSFNGNMNWNDYEISSRDSSGGSIRLSSQEDDTDQQSGSITFSAACIKLVPAGDKTTFYWGVGPIFDLSRRRYINTTEQDDSPRTTYDKYGGTWLGIGGQTLFGVEYAITNRIRFSGDYGISLEYGYLKSSETRIVTTPSSKGVTTSRNSNHSIGIGVNGLKIGISVLI